ncbi:Cytochrome c-551 precursor [Roseivivax sp. THAF40]|uniref:c-type cytochrome n=1 Tax=unclassified Roseivivax TaxID=2639302 RepID=UPI0012694889|nr:MULTISPECIES: c-type cytochrome [unclassified Roseivivax]QFS84781.1 Cytochrome c-551 precursor [Roseivivax sp. THAF197b]QFT48608.1 Cytochrome c-551 precursor [Roseivivax sp. THAF40]
MLRPFLICLFSLAHPALAQEGARLFERCAACHSVVSPSGETLVAGGRIGPNLYGIAGSPAASEPGFNYSQSMRVARQQGLVWSQDAFTAYLRNPTEYLKAYLDDPSARARMAFRLETGGDDVYRYLQNFAR